jgi:uncharacterized protein (DUF1778 family)
MGRPALPPEETRHPLAVRFADSDVDLIAEVAEAEGLSRSEFMRQAVEWAAKRSDGKVRQMESAA